MVNPRRKSQKAKTAIHEAGHAVIGRVTGMVCGGASIVKDNGSVGHAICEDEWAALHKWKAQGKFRDLHSIFVGRIMAYMAGAEAEVELGGNRPTGDGDDRREITLMFEKTRIQERCEVYERRLRRFTRGLVRRHRDKINRVAEALLAHKSLTAEEIDDLMGASPHQDRINSARDRLYPRYF